MKVAKKVAWSVFAALSTPEAVRAEKYLAVVVLARLAITVPAGAFIFERLVELLK